MDKSAEKPKDCQICKKKLGGVFSSQHQCKRCSRTVCKQCCTKKKSIFTKNNTKLEEHRCCDACWPESENISQYIKQNSLAFNTTSKQGKEWAELSEIDLLDNKSPTKGNKGKSEAGIYFLDAWTTMTPSLRELSGTLIVKTSTANVDAALKNVYEKVSNANIDLTTGLAIYLLCHCSQKNTIKIFNYLMKILETIDQKQIISHIELLCHSGDISFDQKNTKNLLNYTKNVYRSYTTAFFLNCLQIDVIHQILLETLLSGDSKIIQLSFACVVYQFKTHILSDKFDDRMLKNLIWQNVTVRNIQKSVKRLRKLIVKKNGPKKVQPMFKVLQSKQPQKKQQQKPPNPPNLPEQPKLPKQLPQKSQQLDEELTQKLSQAAQFLRKLESGELHDQELDLTDVDSLDRYLDNVIEENQRSLKECQQFDKLLNAIEGQLYTRVNVGGQGDGN